MRGNITRRGKTSWRLKYDMGTDPETGERLIQYQTIHGTRRQAEAELAKLLNELADGRYVAPTVETVETYARHWLEAIAPASCSAITLERYASRIRAYIIPGLGSTKLQALTDRPSMPFTLGSVRAGGATARDYRPYHCGTFTPCYANPHLGRES